jgi:hypothetical protein
MDLPYMRIALLFEIKNDQKRKSCKSMKISVLALFLLAGCATNQQGGYVFTGFTPAPRATPAELAASDDATCKSYGAVFGTPDYIQCREHISDQRQAYAPGAATIDTPAAQTMTQTTTQSTTPPPIRQNYCYHDGSETTCTPTQ